MVSTSKISTYLAGVEFPCTKDHLINHAMQQGAPQDVVSSLRNLPDREYFSLAGVWDGMGEIE